MMLNGRKTTVQKGDFIAWDQSSWCVVVQRPSQNGEDRLMWEASINPDDKHIAPIYSERDFFLLVDLVAQMMGMETKVVRSSASNRPTYQFV
ncbi:MAG: hypothetical protein NTX96_03405 [Candidatus Zambryskibacteria bacterium]|nr:hypothetical protein [Candidatus Zambryskibacteria bacterium]